MKRDYYSNHEACPHWALESLFQWVAFPVGGPHTEAEPVQVRSHSEWETSCILCPDNGGSGIPVPRAKGWLPGLCENKPGGCRRIRLEFGLPTDYGPGTRIEYSIAFEARRVLR